MSHALAPILAAALTRTHLLFGVPVVLAGFTGSLFVISVNAAASHATLVALLISVALGLIVLVPALVLLFGLVLSGGFDEPVPAVEQRPVRRPATWQRSVAGVAIALFVVGGTLTFLGEGAVLAMGVIALAAFVVVGVAELLRPEVLGWAGTPGEAPQRGQCKKPGLP
jgi:hypothetical protein